MTKKEIIRDATSGLHELNRSKARNRVTSRDISNASKIKLLLHEKTDFRKAIRHALDNSYRWTPFNISEIRKYMEAVEDRLNPLTVELLVSTNSYVRPEIYLERYTIHHSVREIYQDIGLEWNSPDCFYWLVRFLDLWELSRNRKELSLKNYTIKEWFKAVDLEYPHVLEPDSNIVISRRSDLERTGIFEDLDLKIKESLKIEDELEHAYHNWDSLNSLEKAHIKVLVNTPAVSNKHPYSILLKEIIASEHTRVQY